MADWLAQGVRADGAAPALIEDQAILSHTKLDAGVDRLARRLTALGVSAGDRVATTLAPSAAWIELVHALPRLGAMLVPLNPREPAPERRRQLEQVGARLVIDEPLEGDEAEPVRVDPSPDDPHTVIFTSGTTGRARPVLLTHANHEASALAAAARLALGPADHWLSVLPLFHVGGLALVLRAAILGSAVEVHPSFDVDRVHAALAGGGVTHVSLVPTMLERLRRAGLDGAPGLECLLLGGGTAPRDLLEWAVACGLPVVQTYGMTETASQVATRTARDALTGGGIGARALPGVDLAVGPGEEVLVRGPMLAPAARSSEGWLRTGDRGRLDPQGRLTVEGRIGDVIVTGGEKVAPEEVEDALVSHPQVLEAAVVGVPDAEWGERVTAFLVLAGPLEHGELIDHCKAALAPHKVPKAFHPVTQLPRTASGKLRRVELRATPGDSII